VLADSGVLTVTNIILAVAAVGSAGAAVWAVRSSNQVAEANERPVVIEFSSEAVQLTSVRPEVGSPYTSTLTLTLRNVAPGVAAIRDAYVRSGKNKIPATPSAWVVPTDVSYLGVKINADVSSRLDSKGELGVVEIGLRYEDVSRNRYESLFMVGRDEHDTTRILGVRVYFCGKPWKHKEPPFIDTGAPPAPVEESE
jgi:hypothetical protein